MPQYSEKPGARERHLLRRKNNPLFPPERQTVSPQEFAQTLRQDREDVTGFMQHFQDLVAKAVNLETNADSQVILDLKQELDHSYETCCGLSDDQSEIKQAIRKLLQVIMKAIWLGAEQDPQAQSKLRDEETARNLHFQLLETPLVADLLNPESPIQQNELSPTLLSASEAELHQALQLFEAEQLASICSEGKQLLLNLEAHDEVTESAWDRLTQMETWLASLAETHACN